MGIEVLIPILAIISVLLIPILGITIVFTTRFAFKPLAETIAAALRDSGHPAFRGQEPELRALAEQVEALTDEVHRLREAGEFDRKLLEGRGVQE